MAETAPRAGLEVDYPAGGVDLRLSGSWLNASIAEVNGTIKAIEARTFTGAARIDLTALEAEFVKVAKAYSARNGYSYAAWRTIGVDAAVLTKAGISRSSG